MYDKILGKHSDESHESYCLLGPCPVEMPSNADHFRSLNDDEIAELLHRIWEYGANGENPFSDKGEALTFLKQPFTEGVEK